MTEKIILNAKKRTAEEKNNALRMAGSLPANLFGHGEESQSLTLDYSQFIKVYNVAGTSSLINLAIEGDQPVNVLIEEVQRHPRTDKLLHVDFHKVKMTEKIKTEIEVVYENDAPAVKELGGTLIKNYDQIEIECLPGDLVHEIKIDLGVLKNLHDVIQIKDLVLPKGIVALVEPEEVLVTVLPTRIEEEPKAAEAEALPEAATAEGATAGEPEDEKKEKKKE